MSDAFQKQESLEQEFALFKRIKKDPAAVGELYDKTAKGLYGFLLKRSGHKETAEDLVSVAFMKFLEALPNLEWRNVRLSALLYRIASNALIDHWRKASTKYDTELETEEFDLPSADDPLWRAQISMESAKVIEIMKTLSTRDQEILDMRFFAGLEPAEIANLMNVSPNHAAVLVYRALGRVRKKIVQNQSKVFIKI